MTRCDERVNDSRGLLKVLRRESSRASTKKEKRAESPARDTDAGWQLLAPTSCALCISLASLATVSRPELESPLGLGESAHVVPESNGLVLEGKGRVVADAPGRQ